MPERTNNSQTAFDKPHNKLLINLDLELSAFRRKSQTSALPYWPGFCSVNTVWDFSVKTQLSVNNRRYLLANRIFMFFPGRSQFGLLSVRNILMLYNWSENVTWQARVGGGLCQCIEPQSIVLRVSYFWPCYHAVIRSNTLAERTYYLSFFPPPSLGLSSFLISLNHC